MARMALRAGDGYSSCALDWWGQSDYSSAGTDSCSEGVATVGFGIIFAFLMVRDSPMFCLFFVSLVY